MKDQKEKETRQTDSNEGFITFFTKRILLAILFIAAVIAVVFAAINKLEKPGPWKNRVTEGHVTSRDTGQQPSPFTAYNLTGKNPEQLTGNSAAETGGKSLLPVELGAHDSGKQDQTMGPVEVESSKRPSDRQNRPKSNSNLLKQIPLSTPTPFHATKEKKTDSHAVPAQTHSVAVARSTGVAFVEAVISPIDYELNERFWGWRPNDIINFTDNVNHYQLGTLEVTRRSVVQLAERISRTGSTDAFNSHLENAMNWLMVSPDSYWFPSPEKKYKESLDELEAYKNALETGSASFYTRADNLIPLLSSYEDLLGSCDENLVKSKEKDGSKVGWFTADNYFYYAKGVAATMAVILEAINHDFRTTVGNRNGAELLHHAILSCELAASLEPIVVTNGSLDGILANHRAHMAAPISHARYYIGQLIKTLST